MFTDVLAHWGGRAGTRYGRDDEQHGRDGGLLVQGSVLVRRTVTAKLPYVTDDDHPPATAAFVTGLHGIWTNRPQYTVATGLAAANSGVTAATFFSLRELVVRPLLRDHVPPPTSVRRENLIESGVSGALTGGLLRGIRCAYACPSSLLAFTSRSPFPFNFSVSPLPSQLDH
ncbi:hypothetical protein GGG16DRAFT_123431 [Schizophyllum commune]